MNKNFLLPTIVRKMIYNKPTLAFNKVITHTAGIIDFEHWTFPFESYDQLRASGILPKGNIPLFYFFEIPFITLGFYILIRSRKMPLLLPLFLAAFVPYLVFDKRDLVFSGVFFIQLVLAVEVIALNLIFNKFNELNYPKKMLVSILLGVFTIPSIINFYNLFFFDKERYTRSDQFLYRDIASWISENKGRFQKIVVTDRFGPTHLATAFYLNIPPELFWESYLNPQELKSGQTVVRVENLEFRAINWREESRDANIAYVGFLGEFTDPSESVDAKETPKDVLILKEIPFSDELVWQYG
ncbi:MAG: hypothetical protein AABY10_05195, partial [Nanoarchaeota archaeon]